MTENSNGSRTMLAGSIYVLSSAYVGVVADANSSI